MALKTMFLTMVVTTIIMVMMTTMVNAQSTPKGSWTAGPQGAYKTDGPRTSGLNNPQPGINKPEGSWTAGPQGAYKTDGPRTSGSNNPQQGINKTDGPRTSGSNNPQPGSNKPEGSWTAGPQGAYKTEGPRTSGFNYNQPGTFKTEGPKMSGPSGQAGTNIPGNLPTFKLNGQPESARPVNTQTNKPAYSDGKTEKLENRPHFYPDTRKPDSFQTTKPDPFKPVTEEKKPYAKTPSRQWLR